VGCKETSEYVEVSAVLSGTVSQHHLHGRPLDTGSIALLKPVDGEVTVLRRGWWIQELMEPKRELLG
jgi:hypothetical protein